MSEVDDIDESRLPLAFVISLGAMLCSILGAAAVLFRRRPSKQFLGFGMGFSGGVMIFLSIHELLASSRDSFQEKYGRYSLGMSLGMFVVGAIVTQVLDHIVDMLQKRSGVNAWYSLG